MSCMTQTQEKIFEQVNALLTEHFNAAVVSVCYQNDDGKDYVRYWYSGGRVQAIGLVRSVEMEMVSDQIEQEEQPDGTE